MSRNQRPNDDELTVSELLELRKRISPVHSNCCLYDNCTDCGVRSVRVATKVAMEATFCGVPFSDWLDLFHAYGTPAQIRERFAAAEAKES